VGQRLWCVALALYLCYGAAVLNAALPLQRLDPRWQETLIAALISNGPLPLIGLALSHLAVVLQPANRLRSKRFRRIKQLAVVAALGFLLLIPLQVSATWRRVQDSTIKVSLQQQQGQQTISALRQAISAATSHQDLQTRLEKLQLPVAGQADLQVPFPQRQQKLLDGLLQSEMRLNANISSRQPLPLGPLLQSVLRIAPTALALAWAFRALGRWPASSGGPGQSSDAAYFKAISARKPE
jgi:hypothetical protein